ncbi:MAG: hypothetical protein AAB649_07425 [Patescibacteria group bacterium]
MLNISVIAALEIFMNPHDLEFVISENGGKFALRITRGPAHSFKVLFLTDLVFPNKTNAVAEVATTLNEILGACTQQLKNPASSLAQRLLDPGGELLDGVTVLTDEMHIRIANELDKQNFSSTYAW